MIEWEAPDSPISKMLEFWLELKSGCKEAPQIDDFSLARLWQMKIPNRVTIVDCTPSDPANFRVIYHAYDPGRSSWLYGQSITGVRLADLPSRMLSRSLQRTYVMAKSRHVSATLQYHWVRQHINGVWRNFNRLLLPFVDAHGAVSTLMIPTRLNQPLAFDPQWRHPSKDLGDTTASSRDA